MLWSKSGWSGHFQAASANEASVATSRSDPTCWTFFQISLRRSPCRVQPAALAKVPQAAESRVDATDFHRFHKSLSNSHWCILPAELANEPQVVLLNREQIRRPRSHACL